MDWLNSRGKRFSQVTPEIVVNASHCEPLLRDLEHQLETGCGFTLATLNLDHVVKIRKLPQFREAYEAHSHVTADGNPIVWLSRLARQNVELVPGSELVRPVLALAASHQVTVALFGSTEQVLDAASKRLCSEMPALQIVTCIAPPQAFDPESPQADALITHLKASGAGLVLLALGAPKQEIFAIRASKQMPQAGFVSVGAGIDFIAGTQVRAPRVVRVVAAEWLWRLMSNPVRFAGRYAQCIAILPSLVHAALQARRMNTPERQP